MDEVRTQPDPWGSSQGRDNTSLGARFIQELLDQPDDSQPIPLGATVILMPPVDEPDPELAAATMRRAEKLVAEGRTVILWTVGQEPPYTTVPEVTSLSTTADS